ncbi:MAG TPA: glycine zipper domain-containing protein [Woeseiaceae bacterium]|nr:glycine zipper domain-containing protein [Woeseiaceae bacterium]
MNKIRFLVALGLCSGLVACAAHPDPIVDMKGVNPDRFAQDWADCESDSEQIEIGKGVAKGAGAGGAVGAVGGAIHDDIGRGAATGALIGATRSGLDADREKQQVFKRCLRGRGYKVLN